MPKNEDLTPEDQLGRLAALANGVFRVVLGTETAENVDLNPLDEQTRVNAVQVINGYEHLGETMLAKAPGATRADDFNRASNLELLLTRLGQHDQRQIAAMVPSDERDDISYFSGEHGLPLMADVFAPVKK